MAVPAPQPHVLACRNLVLGTCNLLVLAVPAGWRVLDGLFPPEVDAWTLHGSVNWATAGQGAWRVAVPPGPGRPAPALVELTLRLTPAAAGAAPADPAGALARTRAAGSLTAAGHPARWALGEVRRGLLRRPRPALAAGVVCPHTRRRLDLLLEGAGPADLQELWSALAAGLACH